MAAAEVKPTRAELIDVRRRIDITEGGHRILRLRRDGLILEFFKVLKDAVEVRKKIMQQYIDARHALSIAQAIDGALVVSSAANAVSEIPPVEVGERNIIGLRTARITSSFRIPDPQNRGYGIIGTSYHIDYAAELYALLLETAIRAAEIEATMRKLLDEIERARRRVSALEFVVLPELRGAESFIRMRLEELEREDKFRMKRIKQRAESSPGPSAF